MNHYVSPAGLDENDGTWRHPLGTLQWAVAVAAPYDAIVADDGDYTRGGTVDGLCMIDKPLTFRARNRGKARLVGDGKSNSAGFRTLPGVGMVVIEGFEVCGFPWFGCFLGGNCHHVAVRHCHIHHIGGKEEASSYGICGIFDEETAKSNLYDSNIIHDIGRSGPKELGQHDHGIYTCGQDHQIVNNVIYDCDWGWGVQVSGARNISIRNNTFAFGTTAGQIVCSGKTYQNIRIERNIFYRPLVAPLWFFRADDQDMMTISVKENFLFGLDRWKWERSWTGGTEHATDAVPLGVGNIMGQDPLFIDPEHHDFRLRADSPCLPRSWRTGAKV